MDEKFNQVLSAISNQNQNNYVPQSMNYSLNNQLNNQQSNQHQNQYQQNENNNLIWNHGNSRFTN